MVLFYYYNCRVRRHTFDCIKINSSLCYTCLTINGKLTVDFAISVCGYYFFKSVNHTSYVSSAKCSSCLEIPVLNYQYFMLNTRFYNSEIHTPTQFATTHKIILSETTFSNVEPTAKRMSTFSINGETQFVSREGW